MSCTSGKRAYPAREIAEQALIQAHVTFSYARGRGPVAVYQCDDCGQFHFTSSGPMKEALTQALRNGEIAKRKEAGHWESKWGGRR